MEGEPTSSTTPRLAPPREKEREEEEEAEEERNPPPTTGGRRRGKAKGGREACVVGQRWRKEAGLLWGKPGPVHASPTHLSLYSTLG